MHKCPGVAHVPTVYMYISYSQQHRDDLLVFCGVENHCHAKGIQFPRTHSNDNVLLFHIRFEVHVHIGAVQCVLVRYLICSSAGPPSETLQIAACEQGPQQKITLAFLLTQSTLMLDDNQFNPKALQFKTFEEVFSRTYHTISLLQ